MAVKKRKAVADKQTERGEGGRVLTLTPAEQREGANVEPRQTALLAVPALRLPSFGRGVDRAQRAIEVTPQCRERRVSGEMRAREPSRLAPTKGVLSDP